MIYHDTKNTLGPAPPRLVLSGRFALFTFFSSLREKKRCWRDRQKNGCRDVKSAHFWRRIPPEVEIHICAPAPSGSAKLAGSKQLWVSAAIAEPQPVSTSVVYASILWDHLLARLTLNPSLTRPMKTRPTFPSRVRSRQTGTLKVWSGHGSQP